MGINFESIKIETDFTKELQELEKVYAEKETIELAKKKAACFDALIVYLDDLRRIREQYTAFRMYYFDDYPEGDEEPRVSKDEIILDSLINIMDASKAVVRDQILKPGFFLKDVRELEWRMQEIHKADEE